MGRRRTTISVYEVPSFLRDANLAAYMLNPGDIVSATHNRMLREWRFDIILDVKTYSIPNWLDMEVRRLPVIVSGRKPVCWRCDEIGHLSAVCLGKKAPKKRMMKRKLSKSHASSVSIFFKPKKGPIPPHSAAVRIAPCEIVPTSNRTSFISFSSISSSINNPKETAAELIYRQLGGWAY